MIRICHLLDRRADWDHRLAVTQLLDRLPKDRYAQTIAAISPLPEQSTIGLPRHHYFCHAPVSFWPGGLLAAAGFRSYLEANPVNILHVWGIQAAVAASVALGASDRTRRARRSDRGSHVAGFARLAVQCNSPREVTDHARLLRTFSKFTAMSFLCSSAVVRRRLLEGGIPSDACVVIRPGVDFSRINAYRKSNLRERLGVADSDRLILLQPASRSNSGASDAFWAATLLNYLEGCWRIIIADRSEESSRIHRVAPAQHGKATLAIPPKGTPFEALIAVSDIFLRTGTGEEPTTAVAWAMAAGVPVIAAAEYAAAELIASKLNGLLYKQSPRGRNVITLARTLRDRESLGKVRETARGQAFEVFGLRRFIEQHIRVYENLLLNKPPGEGITDSAIPA